MNTNNVDRLLDHSTDEMFNLHEDLVFEANHFRNRHSNTCMTDERLISDIVCLVLRFGRSSEMVGALIEDQYGVQRSLTAFWFVSQITLCVDVINDICRDVDQRTMSAENALKRDLDDEALLWTEDFSMSQPDHVRIELKFGMPPTTAAA